jgi:hypothetical protein
MNSRQVMRDMIVIANACSFPTSVKPNDPKAITALH